MGKNLKKENQLSLSTYRKGLTNSRLRVVSLCSKICKRVWYVKIWAAKPPAGEVVRAPVLAPSQLAACGFTLEYLHIISQSLSLTHRLPSKREIAGSLHQHSRSSVYDFLKRTIKTIFPMVNRQSWQISLIDVQISFSSCKLTTYTPPHSLLLHSCKP